MCPRRTGRLSGGDPISFLEKKPGKEKKERGTSRSPLHSPPKGRPFWGPPHIGRVQRFPDRQKARNWPRRTLEILPQQNESRDAFWGSPEGGIPPGLSFPPLSLQRKRCSRRAGGPRGERNSSGLPGKSALYSSYRVTYRSSSAGASWMSPSLRSQSTFSCQHASLWERK